MSTVNVIAREIAAKVVFYGPGLSGKTTSLKMLLGLVEPGDEVVVLETPARFYAVGAWYREFPQLRDDEVRALLEGAAERLPEGSRAARSRAAASSRAGG